MQFCASFGLRRAGSSLFEGKRAQSGINDYLCPQIWCLRPLGGERVKRESGVNPEQSRCCETPREFRTSWPLVRCGPGRRRSRSKSEDLPSRSDVGQSPRNWASEVVERMLLHTYPERFAGTRSFSAGVCCIPRKRPAAGMPLREEPEGAAAETRYCHNKSRD